MNNRTIITGETKKIVLDIENAYVAPSTGHVLNIPDLFLVLVNPPGTVLQIRRPRHGEVK